MDVRVCFAGDSYVLGQGDDTGLGWTGRVLCAARSGGVDLTVYNLGIRGETGPEIARRLEVEVASRLGVGDRRAVVIAFGANDTSRDVPIAHSIAAARRMLVWTQGQGLAAFLLPPPPRPHTPEWDARAATLTADMADLAAELGVPFLNLREVVPDWALWWTECAAGDGSHPNGSGYQLIAAAFTAWPAWRSWLGA